VLAAALSLIAGGCREAAERNEDARVEVAPARAELNVGGRQAFTARLQEGGGGDGFAWSSSDPAVAAVGADGVATGQGGGNAWISASGAGGSGRSLLFVAPLDSFHAGRPEEWYRTQMDTGQASRNNCGPTAVHMAIAWYRGAAELAPGVEEIRGRHVNNNGWWSTADVSESLTHYGVPHAAHSVSSADSIRACLQRGRVVILCLEMKWIRYDRHPFYDRFYTFDSGHFLVVKGWSADGRYLVVYDPNSWSQDAYGDGTFMGRNRYYLADEVCLSARNWWSYLFEIGAPASAGTAAFVPEGRAGPREAESR
jgi:hypothetical protein